jgi:hypothetical protein
MKLVVVVAFIATALFVGLDVVAASWFQDPMIIGRAGATLSAIGAALVVYQAFVEEQIDRRNASEMITISTLPPIEAELAAQIQDFRLRTRREKRIKVVAFIAFLVCLGELLHGWGDILYVKWAILKSALAQ